MASASAQIEFGRASVDTIIAAHAEIVVSMRDVPRRNRWQSENGG